MKTKLILFLLNLICAISLNAQISFVSPAGGEQWEIGSTHDVIINNLSATAIEWPMLKAEWSGGSEYFAFPMSIEPGINTFSWTINPSQFDVASDYTIRILDGGFMEIAFSNQFEVVSALPEITTISNPSTGDFWFNGNTYSITFQCLSVSSVNIFYSTDGSTNWQQITSNFSTVDGNNTYSWNVSGIIGTNPNAKLKIESVANNTISKISDAFTLAEEGLVSFISPAGGEQWEIGSTHDVVINNLRSTAIEWPMLKAEWSGGSGYFASPMSIEPGINTFSWTINSGQFDVASDYTILVEDGEGTEIVVSNQFEVVASPPEITAISNPSTGDFWFNGITYPIVFQCLSVTSVNIYYSTDGSTNWQQITSNFSTVDGSNIYSWNVSGIIGTNPNAKLKIESVANNTISKISDAFTLAEEGLVSFISPAGGEQWEQESTYNIEIINPSASSYNNCEIMINGSGGVEYVSYSYNLLSGSNNILFTIPNSLNDAADYKIIVNDFNSGIIGASNLFAIGQPISSVISPTTGDFWYNGNDFNIKWQSNGVSNVDIYYSLDGATNWQTIASNVASFNSVTNSYSWSVSGISGTNTSAKIKIANSSNSSHFLYSNSFTLAENSNLSFSSPAGGEIWAEGSTQTIEIQNTSANIYSNCNLVVSRLGNEVPLGSSYTIISGLNSISWNIDPYDFYPANDYVITLFNSSDEPIAVSNQFEISGTMGITEISSPYASAIWYNQNEYNIYWASSNVASVNIYYSLDGSTNWQTVATDVASNDGYNNYQWSVTGITGVNPNSKIKIESSINSSVFNTSNTFTLAESAPMAFVSPAGGEEWEIGSEQTIEIINLLSASFNNCRVRAYWSSGSFYETISNNYTCEPGVNSLTWTISPYLYDVADDYVIKIYDINSNILCQSNEFKVIAAHPQISEVGSPAADSYWSNGNDYYIEWMCYSIYEVNISYSLDGATNWQTIATNVASNDGYNNYQWSVAGITGVNTNSKIKIESSINSSVFNMSNTFTLAETSPVAFVSPAGGEEWELGSIQTIQINNFQSTAYLHCEVVAYWSDNNQTRTIAVNYTLNSGLNSLSWTINPSFYDVEDDYILMILDQSYNILDQSGTFEVIEATPQISEVTYPIENSYWFNGNDYYIRWTSLNVNFVNISYSLDGATNWQTIATNIASNNGINYYTWSVSGITGVNPNSRIKVESSINSDVFNTSSEFTLAESSPLAFVSPAGGEEWEIGSVQTIDVNNLISTSFDNCSVMAYSSNTSIYETINSSFTLNPGNSSFSWTINPSLFDIAEDYILLIYDENSNLLAQSNQFKLIAAQPQISEVAYPEEDSYWFNGSNCYISWTSLNVDEVNISYSYDGSIWQTIATNVASSDAFNIYYWSITGITGINPNSRIKVESSLNPDVFNTSSDFTLAESSPLAFVSPAGGEEWEVGSEQTIEINNLNSTIYSNCSVVAYWSMFSNETINYNFTFEPGINSLSWSINPYMYEISDNYVLKIFDENYNLLAQSNQFKVIAAQPQISEVGNPASDSYWYNGHDYYIEWICLSVSEVNISYSLDGETNWQTIATNVASYDGYNNYTWSLAGITGVNPNSKIKVESSINPDVFNTSYAFTLAETSPVAFVSPAGGEEWEMGSEQTIEINNLVSTSFNNLRIRAYWLGGGIYETINDNYTFEPGINSLSWTINPSFYEIADDYVLRIYDQNSNLLCQSNEFKVIAAQPQITEVGNPASDSYWYNGNDYYIEWICLSVSEVNISYSLDGATNWQTIATNEASYDGYNNYLWSVAGITGVNSNSKIKVESSINTSVYSNSSVFTLAESSPITFVSPAGGEEWDMGSEQTIEINNASSIVFEDCQIAAYWGTGDYAEILSSYDFVVGDNEIIWEINPSVFDVETNYIIVIYDQLGTQLAMSNEFSVIESDYIVLSSDDLSIASAANSEQTFSITANVSWTVSTSESWLTADPTSGSNNATITLTAQENNTGSLRTANVTVSDGNIVRTIVVTQDFMSSTSTVIADLISVYPNPNSGDFTISLKESGEYTLAIYNSLGQIVWSQYTNMSEQQEYAVSGLVLGTYILKLVSEENTEVVRIVIR